MAGGSQKRTRSERVAALELRSGPWRRAWKALRRGDVLARLGLCVAAAVALCAVIRGWNPPFPYRSGYVPPRDIVARTSFKAVDLKATANAREQARRQVRCIYVHDPQPLNGLVGELRKAIDEVLAADPLVPNVWADFRPPAGEEPTAEERSREQLERFREAVRDEKTLRKITDAVDAIFAKYRDTGLLKSLPQKPGLGSQEEIVVYRAGQFDARRTVPVKEVLFDMDAALEQGLRQRLGSDDRVQPVLNWLRLHVRPSLAQDEVATREAMDAALAKVDDVIETYDDGAMLAVEGQPLSEEQVRILRAEYDAAMAQRPRAAAIARGASIVALILALFALGAAYIYHHERRLAASVRELALMLLLAVVTVQLAMWAAADAWRAELIPLLLFGQTVAIVYRQALALLLCGMLALILAMGLSYALAPLLLLLGVSAAAILQLGRIRTRKKLIYVGLLAGAVAFVLTVGLAVLEGQPLEQPTLWKFAVCNAMWTVATGFLMLGLLPFIEHLFGVLTDISLLELGDVSHPLLQELVRRAPSTYNHSITVGSIAEAAAEAIGARGLLVRVGAYYHDIGKMLKPTYFVENQRTDGNLHESLVPAMSTLVIIAHVKDGADLARQHGLPEPLIDFIEQHHGTTLVEYFYGRAQRQQPEAAGSVDESAYRYPGPRPQTREAGVMMLADAVESASRSLVDPAPARIESLVREVAERKLDDGQFDESGLTLRELRTIEDSMIKSLIANYHGRIKYPEQRTA